MKAILTALIFASSFGLMLLGALMFIHHHDLQISYLVGLLVCSVGFVSFWSLLPEAGRYED